MTGPSPHERLSINRQAALPLQGCLFACYATIHHTVFPENKTGLILIFTPKFTLELLRSESPSGMCAKLHTVAASNNIETCAAITLLLLGRATYIWVLLLITFRSWWTTHFSATPAEWLQQGLFSGDVLFWYQKMKLRGF